MPCVVRQSLDNTNDAMQYNTMQCNAIRHDTIGPDCKVPNKVTATICLSPFTQPGLKALIHSIRLGGNMMAAFSTMARMCEECSTIHSPPRLFFFKVEISSRTLILLFWPGSVHSGSASIDNCGRVFPEELRVNSFPDRFPHCAWTAA